jgi:hypothetical protein
LEAAHRATYPLGLRLIAAGHDDATADDDRTAPQARVVALLDRREERVEIGVQHGTFGHVFDYRTE